MSEISDNSSEKQGMLSIEAERILEKIIRSGKVKDSEVLADILKLSSVNRVKIEEQNQKKTAEEKKTKSDRVSYDFKNGGDLLDGILYASIHKDKYIFNKTSEEWLFWAGHYWKRDTEGRARAAVEVVVEKYFCLIQEFNDEMIQAGQKEDNAMVKSLGKLIKLLYGRVKKLRSDRGREVCLKFAHTNPYDQLSILGDKIDTVRYQIACENGVINLQTGELEEGRSEDFITRASPIKFFGLHSPAPVFEKFLSEIFSDNRELVNYIRRLFGYVISGLCNEHIFVIFYGSGRNGKSTLVEIIRYVLGVMLAFPLQAEMLLDQGRVRNSAGPSPDIMSLFKILLAIASESDEGRRFSPSRVKWLTGSDTLVGRSPHDRFPTAFIPTHTLFLLCNDKPDAPSNDFAFWSRVHLIPFDVAFVNRKPQSNNERLVDKDLFEKLKKEASGILAWLVRGCLEWQNQGLNPPLVVREATAQYQRDEDILSDFFDCCCELCENAQVSSSALYGAFETWFSENVSKNIVSRKKFGGWMTKKGFRKEKKRNYIYHGLTLLEGDH